MCVFVLEAAWLYRHDAPDRYGKQSFEVIRSAAMNLRLQEQETQWEDLGISHSNALFRAIVSENNYLYAY